MFLQAALCKRLERQLVRNTAEDRRMSPAKEPGWRSAWLAWRGRPGERCRATALAEPWEIGGNNRKQTRESVFTGGWVNGKGAEDMACRCKYSLIFHLFLHIRSSALPAMTTPFISENRISSENT